MSRCEGPLGAFVTYCHISGSYFSFKPYVVTPHLNCLIELVQMRGHHVFMQY